MVWRPSLQHRGRPLGGSSPKYRPIDGCDRFRLSARLHVQFDYQIGAPVQTPRESLRQQRRHLTRRPSEKIVLPGSARSAGSARRSREPGPRRRTRSTRAWCRCGCWRGARPARCRVGTRGRARTSRVDGKRMHEDAEDIVALRLQQYGSLSVPTRSGVPSCQPAVHRRGRGSQLHPGLIPTRRTTRKGIFSDGRRGRWRRCCQRIAPGVSNGAPIW